MNVDFGNDIYTIDFTDPLNGSFAIQPFTTNGPLNPTSASLAPGATSAATTLTLVGRGLPGWGESVIENMVHMLEHFSGPTEPTYMVPGQMWFDTTNTPNDVLKVRNQANDAWNAVLTVGTDLDFGGFKGINVGDATDPTDAMNQLSSDVRYVNVSGDTMDAGQTLTFLAGGEVLGLPATPSATGAASKEYVDVQIPLVTDPLYVNVSGDTMVGVLTLFADPVADLQAATKRYVDNNFVELTGDTMLGFLTLSANPTIAFHAATKQYVDSAVTSVGGDGVVDTGSFNAFVGGGTITLTRTEGLPNVTIPNINAHPHDASDVTYQTPVEGQHLENTAPDLFASGYTQTFVNFLFDQATQVSSTRNKREFAVLGDFAGATLTLGFSYPTETNRLQVFLYEGAVASGVGGRKLVADERGVSIITFVSSVSASNATGLVPATSYDFDINVDGGGAATMTVLGSDAVIFGQTFTSGTGLVDAMNAEFVSNAVPAVALFEDGEIFVYSNTTGGGTPSSVVITDPGGTYLFDELDAAEETIVDFNLLIDGSNITNGGGSGDYWTIESTGTSYYVWYDDGLVGDPAPGGTGIAVAFTVADSPTLLASNTATALTTSGEAEFAGAGAVAGILTVLLTVDGPVADSTIGSFPVIAPTISVVTSQQGITTTVDNSNVGVTHDYSEDGPALSDSTSFTLPGAPDAADEFEIIRIK